MAKRKLSHRSFDLYSSYSYYLPGWKGLFWLLAMFIIGALLGNLFTLCMLACFKSFPAESVTNASMLISYPVMFIPPMLYASYQSRTREGFGNIGLKLDSNNFGFFSKISIALAVFVATIAMAFVMDIFNAILPPMPEYLEKAMSSMTGGPLWITLLCVSVFAPFFEEWLCRGMILRGMLQHMKPAWAIIVSALFFALIHMNPWQAIPAFGFGLLFGYVYYKTGSLKLTMLMHCTNNTLSALLARSAAFGDCNSFMDVMGTTSYVLMYILCALWVGYFVLRISRISLPFGSHGNFDRIGLPDEETMDGNQG